MTGLICLWSGAIVDIPFGWALCDGSLGTPDLTDRFVLGAGRTFNPGDVGGETSHLHTFTTLPHNHTMQPGAALAVGAALSPQTTSVAVGGSTFFSSSLPAYYALAFIMKL